MPRSRLHQLPFDRQAVTLTPQEAFVLSRFDRELWADEVASVVGLDADETAVILRRLLELGVLVEGPSSERPQSGLRPSQVVGRSAVTSRAPSPPFTMATSRVPGVATSRVPGVATSRVPGAATSQVPAAASQAPAATIPSPAPTIPSAAPSSSPVSVRPQTVGPSRFGSGGSRSSMPAVRVAPAIPSAPAVAPPGLCPFDPDPLADEAERLHHERFAGLAPSARAASAQRATGVELLAHCFDPHPQVVLALLANAAFGPVEARYVAWRHVNATGLELLLREASLLRSSDVRSGLLANPRLTEPLLERVLAAVSLDDLYHHVLEERLPLAVRHHLAAALRVRFDAARPKERADLIYWSNGQALVLLEHASFDEELVSVLAARPLNDLNLVVALARFPGTPRALLAALLQQPAVARNAQLVQLIRTHPSAVTGRTSG